MKKTVTQKTTYRAQFELSRRSVRLQQPLRGILCAHEGGSQGLLSTLIPHMLLNITYLILFVYNQEQNNDGG